MRGRRNHIVLAVVLFLWSFGLVAGSSAQDSQDFSARRFYGGNLYVDVRLGSNLFGSGLSGGSFGRIQTSLAGADGATVFGNPARLSFVRHAQMGAEARLPMRNGLFGIGPRSLLSRSSVHRRTDDLLTDLQFPDDRQPTYTQLSGIHAGQPRQLAAFWLNWPVSKHVTFGFGYRQPFLLDGTLKSDGFSVLLSGSQVGDNGSVDVDFLSELSMVADADIVLDEISFGTGGLLERYYWGSVWWGLSIFRYHATATLNLDVLPQGVLTISGADQYFFNDGEDPNIDTAAGESNLFYWTMKAGYRGSGFGGRFGLIHRTYGEQIGTSLMLTVPPRLRMSDPGALAESYLPIFLNLAGSIDASSTENVELLDINKLDVSRPNLTRKSRDYLGTEMVFRMPTALTFGLDLPLGHHRFAVNAIRYWGMLGVVGDYSRENGVIQPYRLATRPSWGLRAGFDLAGKRAGGGLGILAIPVRILTLDLDGLLFSLMGDGLGYTDTRYRFGAGITWGREDTDGISPAVQNSIRKLLAGPVPVSASIGRSYSLMDRIHVGVHVAGLPDLLMRFSVAYDVE